MEGSQQSLIFSSNKGQHFLLPCILKEQRKRTAPQRGTSMTEELPGLLLAGRAQLSFLHEDLVAV